MTVPFDKPLTIVPLDKFPDHLARFRECLEIVQGQTLFCERPNPPLHDPVALGLTHVPRRRANAEPGEFTEKLVHRILRPPVHPESKAERDLGRVAPMRAAHTLENRL